MLFRKLTILCNLCGQLYECIRYKIIMVDPSIARPGWMKFFYWCLISCSSALSKGRLLSHIGNGGKISFLLLIMTMALFGIFFYNGMLKIQAYEILIRNPPYQNHKANEDKLEDLVYRPPINAYQNHKTNEDKMEDLAYHPPINAYQNHKTNEDEIEDLVYHPPINASISGAYLFEVNKTQLSSLLPSPISLDKDNIKDFIFVSAASSAFYPRLTLLVESIQTHYPSHKLVVYDLGLTETQHKTMQTLCNVEVRPFDFKIYEPHVKDFLSYAFKPIIVAMALKEYSGVFWVDASVRFHSGSIITQLQDIALRNDGVCTFEVQYHSIFSVTPPEMFLFLPMVKNPKKVKSLYATLVLLYKTKPVVDRMLKWWVACALSPTCIFSYPIKPCKFTNDRWNDFARCTRADQSALSIILHNAFPDLSKAFGPKPTEDKSVVAQIEIERKGSTTNIKSCELNSN